MSPTIRNIVGQQHSTFSLTRGTIIMVNLDRLLNRDKHTILRGRGALSSVKCERRRLLNRSLIHRSLKPCRGAFRSKIRDVN
jgi:hypothetical protein